jgi:riboflavin synthase
MPADGRFGGHIVQGHVDTVTEIEVIHHHLDGSRLLTFRLPDALAGQIVEKGSVALDGISLTVASVGADGTTFDIAVVPHTLDVTTLGQRAIGDRLNVEADVIARYVAGLAAAGRLSNDRITDTGGHD